MQKFSLFLFATTTSTTAFVPSDSRASAPATCGVSSCLRSYLDDLSAAEAPGEDTTTSSSSRQRRTINDNSNDDVQAYKAAVSYPKSSNSGYSNDDRRRTNEGRSLIDQPLSPSRPLFAQEEESSTIPGWRQQQQQQQQQNSNSDYRSNGTMDDDDDGIDKAIATSTKKVRDALSNLKNKKTSLLSTSCDVDDAYSVSFDDGTKLYENAMEHLEDDDDQHIIKQSKDYITIRYCNEGDYWDDDENINNDVGLEAFQRAKTREQFKQAKAKLSEETTQRWSENPDDAFESSGSDTAAQTQSEFGHDDNINQFDPWNNENLEQNEKVPFFMDIDDNEDPSPVNPALPQLGDGNTITERMLKKVPSNTNSVDGSVGGYSNNNILAFQQAEEKWSKLKAMNPFSYDPTWLRWTQDYGTKPAPQFVATDGAFGNPNCWSKLKSRIGRELDFDIVVCGGTLGIFYAAYLQRKGFKVCVIEAGPLGGREQEWNTNLNQLYQLVEANIISQRDMHHIINIKLSPPAKKKHSESSKSQSYGVETSASEILNLGVSPTLLIENVAERFKERGGTIIEQTRVNGVCLSELVGCAIDLGLDTEPITTKLVLDCMGNSSPITAQQRHGVKPDGICAVVGSCARGYNDNTESHNPDTDTRSTVIKTQTKNKKNQYYWESFSVDNDDDAKTTYMYTYIDADKKRPSLLDLMEDYWLSLPEYQESIQNPETDLDVERIFFAYYPTFRDSPLKPQFSRILPVGDASGIQSPLSFRGFGSVTRQLHRIGEAVSDALNKGCLHRDDLAEINAYQPNLSASWMFQKTMSRRNRRSPLMPFPEKDVTFDTLGEHLGKSIVSDPLYLPKVVGSAGIGAIIQLAAKSVALFFSSFVGLTTFFFHFHPAGEVSNWFGHVGNMAKYSVLDAAAAPVVGAVANRLLKGKPREQFRWRRRMEAWKYGSGADIKKQRKETSNALKK